MTNTLKSKFLLNRGILRILVWKKDLKNTEIPKKRPIKNQRYQAAKEKLSVISMVPLATTTKVKYTRVIYEQNMPYL